MPANAAVALVAAALACSMFTLAVKVQPTRSVNGVSCKEDRCSFCHGAHVFNLTMAQASLQATNDELGYPAFNTSRVSCAIAYHRRFSVVFSPQSRIGVALAAPCTSNHLWQQEVSAAVQHSSAPAVRAARQQVRQDHAQSKIADPCALYNSSALSACFRSQQCSTVDCTAAFGVLPALEPISGGLQKPEHLLPTLPQPGHVLGFTAPADGYPVSLNWTLSTAYSRLGDRFLNFTQNIITRYQCNASARAWLSGIVQRPISESPFTLQVGGAGPVSSMHTAECMNPPLDTPSNQTTGNASQCLLWGTDFACGRHPSVVLSGFAVTATPTPSPGPAPLLVTPPPPPLHGGVGGGLLVNTVITRGFAGLVRAQPSIQAGGVPPMPPPTGGGGFIVSYNTSTLPADGSAFNFTVQLRDQYGACVQDMLAPWNNASLFNLTLSATVQCNVPQSAVVASVECCSPQVAPPAPAAGAQQAERGVGRSFPIPSIAGCGANFTGAITLRNPRQQLFSNAFCLVQVNMQLGPRQPAASSVTFNYPLAVGNYTVVPGTAFESTQNILIIVICTVLGALVLCLVARRAVRRTLGAITTFDAEQDFDTDRRGVLSADGSYVTADETSRQAAELEAANRARHAGRVRACHCLWLPLWLVRCQCRLCGHSSGSTGARGGGRRSRRAPSWPPAQESRTTLLPRGVQQGGARRSTDSSSTAGFSMKGV